MNGYVHLKPNQQGEYSGNNMVEQMHSDYNMVNPYTIIEHWEDVIPPIIPTTNPAEKYLNVSDSQFTTELESFDTLGDVHFDDFEKVMYEPEDLVNGKLIDAESQDLILPIVPNANQAERCATESQFSTEHDWLDMIGEMQADPFEKIMYDPEDLVNGKLNEEESLEKKAKNCPLPKDSVRILTNWFKINEKFPYPNESMKKQLAEKAGLKFDQVVNWMRNKRLRTGYSEKHPEQRVRGKKRTQNEEQQVQDDNLPRRKGRRHKRPKL